MTVEKRMQNLLERRKQRKTLRQLADAGSGLVDFSSNDYLGFATDDILRAEGGAGAGASRLIAGNRHIHEEAEARIARYHRAEAALLFNSGYDANIGLLGCIAQAGDMLLYDELCHASIREGLKLSRGMPLPFRHNDLDDLRKLLESHKDKICFVVTEGLFSMDGDAAPLREMVALCQKYQAAIILDEAHSTGVLGPKGEGLACALGLEREIFARVHTFGKAMGCHGAAALGSETLRQYLINYARPFIFSTAMPPHSAQAIRAAYDALADTGRLQLLHQKTALFRQCLAESVAPHFLPAEGPIQSWVIPDAARCRAAANALRKRGWNVKPIVSPTVPRGKERIRFCIHAFNRDEDIRQLAAHIAALANEL